MASPNIELYTTDCPAGATKTVYKGFIIVNKTKSRNVFSDIGAGFKSMVGGEIKAMTKLTKDLRNELVLISLTSRQLFHKSRPFYARPH